MAIYVNGICVGIKDNLVEFTRDGKADSFRSISASFADPSGFGEPVDVNIDENQIAAFKPFDHYTFPVETRAYLSKRGAALCQISIPKTGKIQKVGSNLAGATNPPQAVPGK